MFQYYTNHNDTKKTYCLRFLYIFIIAAGVSNTLGKSITIYFSIAKLQFMFDITMFGLQSSTLNMEVPGDA
jgi:hypothetical protein